MHRRGSCDSNSSTGSSQESQQQCCLTAGHLFLSCCLLLAAMAGLLIASCYTDRLRRAWTPCLAVFGMAAFLATVSGLLAAFVERKLHERYRLCKYVYCVTCVCCMEADERRQLFQSNREEFCEMSDSSPESCHRAADLSCSDKITPNAFSRSLQAPVTS